MILRPSRGRGSSAVPPARGENGVNPTRRKAANLSRDVLVFPVDSRIGSKAQRQRDAVFAGGGCEHSRTAQLGELNSEGADPARRSVDDDSFALSQMQRIVHSLKRGKSGRGDRAGMKQIPP